MAGPRIDHCDEGRRRFFTDEILHWLNGVQEVSSWAKWTEYVHSTGGGVVGGGGGQRMRWTAYSGEILVCVSDQAIYSNIS